MRRNNSVSKYQHSSSHYTSDAFRKRMSERKKQEARKNERQAVINLKHSEVNEHA
jgi:hypothetical protein